MNLLTPDMLRMLRKIRALKVPAGAIDNVVLSVAQTTRNRMYERMAKGISASGKKFNPYSTKPLRIKEEDAQPPLKAGYYPGGYAQARKEAGRNLNTDRLILTGNMFADFQPRMTGKGEATVGFTNPEQARKFEENQRRYEQFPTTKEEAMKAREDMRTALAMLIRNATRGAK